MKNPSLILLIFILTLSFVGCKEEKKETETEKETETKKNETKKFTVGIANYEIVKIQDQSRKALGKKSLSEYQTSELKNLPTNKKILYRIVFSQDLKENQVKPTIEKIINELTSDDSDIDEIIFWLYSDKDMSRPYDIGNAIWAPFGKLGNIDAEIAKNNNRENYKIEYQIKQNLDEYLTQKSKSEVKFGFTEDERKQIFKEIVNTQDRADKYQSSAEDKVIDGILEKYGKLDDKSRNQLKIEYNKISEKAEKLLEEYRSKVLKKYKITELQAEEISREALAENWPFE
jgi:hypothetical protein